MPARATAMFLLALLFALPACSAASPPATTSAPTAAETSPIGSAPTDSRQTVPTQPEESPADPEPADAQLPAGSVPSYLAGQWSGGPGSRSGYYLKIASDGRYERGSDSEGPDSAGTVVATDTSAVFYDTSGGQESAGLLYTNATGIEVLSVQYAQLGYYSYVRA